MTGPGLDKDIIRRIARAPPCTLPETFTRSGVINEVSSRRRGCSSVESDTVPGEPGFRNARSR